MITNAHALHTALAEEKQVPALILFFSLTCNRVCIYADYCECEGHLFCFALSCMRCAYSVVTNCSLHTRTSTLRLEIDSTLGVCARCKAIRRIHLFLETKEQTPSKKWINFWICPKIRRIRKQSILFFFFPHYQSPKLVYYRHTADMRSICWDCQNVFVFLLWISMEFRIFANTTLLASNAMRSYVLASERLILLNHEISLFRWWPLAAHNDVDDQTWIDFDLIF